MQSFDLQNFKTINTIIERDSKDTTYKYALLRGAVEIPGDHGLFLPGPEHTLPGLRCVGCRFRPFDQFPLQFLF
jgi:hypothetical protein